MTTTVHDIDVIFPDAKELLSTLQSIKPDGKVTADFTFSEGGVSVHWINKAKNFQSSIFLGKNLFERYARPSGKDQVEFTVEVITLFDMLRIFIASDVGGLQMQYPGEHQELILKSMIHEAQEDQHLVPTVFSKIETLAFADSANLSEYIQEPCSTIFSDRGSIFKDAVDDVHVAGNSVLVEMKDHPPQLTLSSVTPDIEVYVDVPIQSLTGFVCTSPSIDHRYDTKHIVRAFSVSPNRKLDAGYDAEHHCGISIDPQGLMKVVHMWKSLRQKIQENHEDENSESMVVTQFLILPKADEANEHPHPLDEDGMSSRVLQ